MTFALLLATPFALAAIYVLFAVRFLSVTEPVDADVLVVEGWIAPHFLPAAVREFHAHHYSLILISGMQIRREQDPALVEGSVLRTLTVLEQLGVPREQLVPCPAPKEEWYHTAKAARAVRARIHELHLHPRGINVITEGIHARKTWAAYRNMFGAEVPVGIIAIPEHYPWWTERWAMYGVARDLLGWMREEIFPLRA